MKKGRIIVLEAIDCAGKTTQADIISEKFGMYSGRLPYYENETGEQIKRHIKEKKKNINEIAFQSLMFANYIEYFKDIIFPKLDRGQDVIITRCTSSMLAYSTYFGMDIKIAKAIRDAFFNYINSYEFIEVCIDIPVEVAMKRLHKRKHLQPIEDVFENDECLTHVRAVYLNHCKHIVDGTQPIYKVTNDIMNIINT